MTGTAPAVPRMLVVGKRTVPIVISEIARATDLSIAHVSRVFGSKRVPSMKTAKKISQHLHVSLDQLYAALNLQ